MPLPSFFGSRDSAQPWSVARAAVFGTLIGAFAGLFKMLGPLRAAGASPVNLLEIVAAALAFALLCAAAAALRNFIARRLV